VRADGNAGLDDRYIEAHPGLASGDVVSSCPACSSPTLGDRADELRPHDPHAFHDPYLWRVCAACGVARYTAVGLLDHWRHSHSDRPRVEPFEVRAVASADRSTH
jgi:hypothetical protein